MLNQSKREYVKTQYENTSFLDFRIEFHNKYSKNKIGFNNWIISQYTFKSTDHILELGCGTAEIWRNQQHKIAECSSLTLTDFSAEMLDKAKKQIGFPLNVQYEMVDIQDIPFRNESFDIVIANMLLYHVPNLNLALSEVSRVLKDSGFFYCATYGENSLLKYISQYINIDISTLVNGNFTLQNGKRILLPYFKSVKRLDYEDALCVTDVDDVVKYVSTILPENMLCKFDTESFRFNLRKNMNQDILLIPKEYGIFICRK